MRRWIGPLVFAAVGVAIMVGLAAIEQPIEARIIGATIIEGSTESANGAVRWDIEYLPDEERPDLSRNDATVLISREVVVDAGKVIDVWPLGDGFATVESPVERLSWPDYLLAASLGFLFGFVVRSTLDGYGYVRGDGEPGSKPVVPVGEERGFYWRS
jgi:hypothetical protein